MIIVNNMDKEGGPKKGREGEKPIMWWERKKKV